MNILHNTIIIYDIFSQIAKNKCESTYVKPGSQFYW
jgi:hypothetical protein